MKRSQHASELRPQADQDGHMDMQSVSESGDDMVELSDDTLVSY